MSDTSFQERMTSRLTERHSLKSDHAEAAVFGMEVLGITLLNLICVLLVGLLLHVLKETVLMLFIMGPLRYFGGGAHSESPWKCLVVTAVVFPALALFAVRLAALPAPVIQFILCISSCLLLFSVIRFAPAENKHSPILTRQRWLFLQRGARISALFIVSVVTGWYFLYAPPAPYILAASLVFLWFSFILCPIGRWLFDLIDHPRKGGETNE